jgi:hypothetical protein
MLTLFLKRKSLLALLHNNHDCTWLLDLCFHYFPFSSVAIRQAIGLFWMIDQFPDTKSISRQQTTEWTETIWNTNRAFLCMYKLGNNRTLICHSLRLYRNKSMGWSGNFSLVERCKDCKLINIRDRYGEEREVGR